EKRWAAVLETLFTQTTSSLREVLALEDFLQEHVKKFIEIRLEVDRLLDREIQPLALQELSAPRREAYRETGYVLRTIRVLIPLFLLAAVGTAFSLIRAITRPVRALMRGTAAVGRGDLRHRLVPEGRDEFTELAHQFNHMVSQLEATTVSKGLLEASEAKLQETVVDLRREITERERAEEERARLQVSLRRSEMMAALGSLVAGVAHEVRNPLFAISSTLDAFDVRFSARDEYQRYIGVLRGEVERLTALMRALLEYGKPPNVELSPDSLREVIAQAVSSCTPLTKGSNVALVYNDQESSVQIRMDRRRLLQVFLNLLENAIQHSPPGGGVVIETEEVRRDGRIWIGCTIKDSGSGFRAEDLPKIFEPFFTRRRGGTGLGLSIVQRIVEEHGGKICASNRPEGGAIVTVRFPLVREEHDDAYEPQRQLGMSPSLC
ncbi:MAG: sensor histidine kinase, partial [Candidatus Binatia bacterium]